jgi:hypothetical protein
MTSPYEVGGEAVGFQRAETQNLIDPADWHGTMPGVEFRSARL